MRSCGVHAMIDVEALIVLQEASFARAQRGLRDSWPRDSGMDAEQLRSFLDRNRYCVLATTTAQPVTIIDHPSERLLATWEARHGSRADWAAAWCEIHPSRLISYSATNEP